MESALMHNSTDLIAAIGSRDVVVLLDYIDHNIAHCTLRNDPEVRALVVALVAHPDTRVREAVMSASVDIDWSPFEAEMMAALAFVNTSASAYATCLWNCPEIDGPEKGIFKKLFAECELAGLPPWLNRRADAT